MSIDYQAALIVGFILPRGRGGQTGEDEVEELANKLGCKFVVFNEGYDDPFQYALVPSVLEDKIDLTKPNVLDLVINEVNKIKDKADTLGIKLPSPVIKAEICVW